MNSSELIIKKDSKTFIIAICLSFILLNAILIANEFYYLAAIPFLIAVALIAFYSFDKILLLIAFFTPLSINLENLFEHSGLTFPTEPLLFVITLIFFLKYFTENQYDKKLLFHPISIAIIINIMWLFLSSLTSQMPIVSIKFLIMRISYVTGFYFLGVLLFSKVKNIKNFIWVYSLPLFFVIVFTIIKHAHYGFTQESSTWVMDPFYKNHGIYALAIAMFIPILFIFILKLKTFKFNLFQCAILLITNIVFIAGLALSYTRAAWLSIGAALIFLAILKFKIQLRTLVLFFILTGGVVVYNYDEMEIYLNKNAQDSSSDYKEHLESISNVSTNASNMERINRWKCAIAMFINRPFWGWGPGTYMFKYGSFQKSGDMTVISTNAGTRGNAHSEYLGALAETGIIGGLTFLLIVLLVIDRGMKLYYSITEVQLKLTVLGIMLGFITYVIHGILNNYLDMDKGAVPFWAFAAMITAMDVYHSKSLSKNPTA